jgi:hypothetical protein
LQHQWYYAPAPQSCCALMGGTLGSSCIMFGQQGFVCIAVRRRWLCALYSDGRWGGRIPFGRHGCALQSDAMGCAIPMASLSVLVDATFRAHVLHPLGPNVCAHPSWCAGEVCIPATLTVLTVPSPPSHLSCLSNPIPPPVFPHSRLMPVIRPVLALT